ncbi:MAG: putative lipid II flippase FtsW [Candidatus Omnitrophica bacterium]|nr:putative lipid II flippase FtsW [Candidatus Omnitrophota bacterium]MBU4302900.1 putative lipid II flippase FtsW [Candidatus Omnitrophota bacterium]MBU4418831.1 putative lipid II flippase FtsW [Candidatus Omnitrophota bacterium]MBU4468148.1 putative lipid II flippase FtsW [Candidatus Omnitrophota bacterium]
MIYSSSSIYAWESYGDSFYFLKRHLSFLAVGVVLAFLAMVIDYRLFRKYAHWLIWIALFLLVLVLIPGVGKEVSGARRWFRFKFISFQPSEFANLALIVYIADFIARKEDKIKMLLSGFIPAICMLGVVTLLILLQPDLGTIIALSSVVLIMLFVAGARGRYILSLILCSLPAFYFLVFSVPYRRARILAFLNPWLDPKGIGFQIIQSQIAIGSGGLLGRGLGHSRQKLFYLPAAHTDFIFSIIGEELGLFGTLGVIVLFMIFIQQGLKIIKNAQDRFGYFLALGLILMISLKAIINIGVSCGVFPTKGLPLPFISYGGSSLIFDLVSLGILVNIARCGEYP